MKRTMRALILCSVILLSLPNIRAVSWPGNDIGINCYNGTSYSASIQLYGPTNITYPMPPGGSSHGPIAAGSYQVYMYDYAPGSHTFTCNGQSVTTSNGYAVFNTSITNTSFATIY